MPMTIKIKKGLDIRLKGEAEKTLSDISSKTFAIKPTDFIGVFPKLLVKVGDEVKAGTPLFFDKNRTNIQFTAPVSGRVSEIKRGAKRVLQEIKIDVDEQIAYEDFVAEDPNKLDREKIIEKLLKSGVWPMLRQRPYSVIADPEIDPKAIHISAFDTNPLAVDYDFIVHGCGEEFQMGLDALAKLTSGKLHLNIEVNTSSKVFTNSKNVQINEFSGPHPSGNVGTQIHAIDPINKGDVVWYLYPQDVLSIGRLFKAGKFDARRTIALCGSEVKKPKYFKTIMGVSMEALLHDNVEGENKRVISGNVFTGDKVENTGYLGFYHSQVSVIPEGNQYVFFGWMFPSFKKHSFYRTALSWMTPKKHYSLNTNMNGGERAIVVTGQFEKVMPLDIYPIQLIKACMIEDIDLMENLGIYEVDEEDFALCEYIDTSKIDIQHVIRKGLDLMRKEMS